MNEPTPINGRRRGDLPPTDHERAAYGGARQFKPLPKGLEEQGRYLTREEMDELDDIANWIPLGSVKEAAIIVFMVALIVGLAVGIMNADTIGAWLRGLFK